MAELRRLLIENIRLKNNIGVDRSLSLEPQEAHYLKRVLRLRRGDLIEIVDGVGHLWGAVFQGDTSIKVSSLLDFPLKTQPRPKPLVGLAVVVPKRGFNELLRMSCEIGVDIIQPLSSDRGVVRIQINGEKFSRWNGILREAVEQCERLWKPELREAIDFRVWLEQRPSKAIFAFATTRLIGTIDFQLWMMELKKEMDQIWVVIGPEGGWTKTEQNLAKQANFKEIQLGDSIMRTSTAAVAATQLMISWRRNGSFYF